MPPLLCFNEELKKTPKEIAEANSHGLCSTSLPSARKDSVFKIASQLALLGAKELRG